MSQEIYFKKKKLELDRVVLARNDLEIKILELKEEIERITSVRLVEIERLKDCVAKQIARENELKKEMGEIEHV